MLTRRIALLSGAAALAGTALAAPRRRVSASDAFVTVRNGRFQLGGRPYHFAGANMWYAAWLGADGPAGNRDRLNRGPTTPSSSASRYCCAGSIMRSPRWRSAT